MTKKLIIVLFCSFVNIVSTTSTWALEADFSFVPIDHPTITHYVIRAAELTLSPDAETLAIEEPQPPVLPDRVHVNIILKDDVQYVMSVEACNATTCGQPSTDITFPPMLNTTPQRVHGFQIDVSIIE